MEAHDQPPRHRSNVMWWTRRFSAPLRESYATAPRSTEDETAEQFLQLLEQAERRISSKKPDG
ncbi:MAG: hypothetical protein ACOYMK_07560 [Hyphomonadaceae bacterium]